MVEGADVKHVQYSQDSFWWTKRSWVTWNVTHAVVVEYIDNIMQNPIIKNAPIK